jgi:hypothetical protein
VAVSCIQEDLLKNEISEELIEEALKKEDIKE